MATYLANHYIAASNDAEFRVVGKALSDAIAAVGGIAKLSAGDSSGQIDWTSVTRPVAINTSAGYEMYKFADTLQATRPVFIKIEFGTGAAGNYIQWWVTIGFAHNGAGTLSGLTSTRTALPTSQNWGLTAFGTSRLSADTNRFTWMLCHDISGFNIQARGFSVERTHNSDGTDSTYGIMLVTCQQTTETYQVVTPEMGVISNESTGSMLMPSTGHGSAGGYTSVYPLFFTAGLFLNPSLCLFGVFKQNVTVGVLFSVTVLGSSRILLPTDSQTTGIFLTVRGGTMNTNGNVCMRWE